MPKASCLKKSVCHNAPHQQGETKTNSSLNYTTDQSAFNRAELAQVTKSDADNNNKRIGQILKETKSETNKAQYHPTWEPWH